MNHQPGRLKWIIMVLSDTNSREDKMLDCLALINELGCKYGNMEKIFWLVMMNEWR